MYFCHHKNILCTEAERCHFSLKSYWTLRHTRTDGIMPNGALSMIGIFLLPSSNICYKLIIPVLARKSTNCIHYVSCVLSLNEASSDKCFSLSLIPQPTTVIANFPFSVLIT